MSDKPTPLPSVEESLKAVAASVAEGQRYGAETRRILDQMARDSAVWKAEQEASVAEGQRYGAETRRILEQMARDSAAWQARYDKNRAEEDARHAAWKAEQEAVLADVNKGLAEIKNTLAETNKTLAKFSQKVDSIGEQWGNYTNTAGEILEKEVFEALDAAKQIGDIRLVKVVPNLCIGNKQYDMLGVNGKTSVLVEVKRSLSVDDVKTFVKKQMKDFPRVFPQFANGGDLVGAMVYHSLRNDNAAKEALDAGLILLRAEGKKGLRQIKTPEAARKPQTAAR